MSIFRGGFTRGFVDPPWTPLVDPPAGEVHGPPWSGSWTPSDLRWYLVDPRGLLILSYLVDPLPGVSVGPRGFTEDRRKSFRATERAQ